jgi:hypothetical protein
VGLIVRPNFVSDVGPCIIVRIATLLSPITAAKCCVGAVSERQQEQVEREEQGQVPRFVCDSIRWLSSSAPLLLLALLVLKNADAQPSPGFFPSKRFRSGPFYRDFHNARRRQRRRGEHPPPEAGSSLAGRSAPATSA